MKTVFKCNWNSLFIFIGIAAILLPIGWIVLNIIFLQQLAEQNGSFKILQASLSGITDDRRLQLLLIAFCFGAFFEGAAGFGTLLAVGHLMLCTFVATGSADHRANPAHILGERTAPRHETSCKAAYGGAIHVECNALDHSLHILFVQASGGAMTASVGTFIACVDTVLMDFMSHGALRW